MIFNAGIHTMMAFSCSYEVQSCAIKRMPNYSPDYCFSLVMGDWCYFLLTEVKEELLKS